MIVSRDWIEARARFAAMLCLVVIAAYMVAAATPDHVEAQLARLQPIDHPAFRLQRIDREWFGNNGPSALLLLAAVFLTTGGPATEPGRGSALITVSLPVTRRRLILSQLGTVLLLVLGLALSGVVATMGGGFVTGARYPLFPALVGAAMQVVSVAPFAAGTLLIQTITRRATLSSALVMSGALIVPAIAEDLLPESAARAWFGKHDFPPMLHFADGAHLHELRGAALSGVVPWTEVGMLLGLTLLFAGVAVAVFDRREL